MVVAYFKLKYENLLARTIKFASNNNQLKEQGAKQLLPVLLRANLLHLWNTFIKVYVDINSVTTLYTILPWRSGTDTSPLFEVRLCDVEPTQADGGVAAVLHSSL